MKYNYTDTFRSVLELATNKAYELGFSEVEPDLLLWGILKEGTSSAVTFFANRGINVDYMRVKLEEQLGEGDGVAHGQVLYSIDSHRVIAMAARMCTRLQAEAIAPLHLVYALILAPMGSSFLSAFMREYGYVPSEDPEIQRLMDRLNSRGLSSAESSQPDPEQTPTDTEVRSYESYQREVDLGGAKIKVGTPYRRTTKSGELVPIMAFSRDSSGKIRRNPDLLKELSDQVAGQVEKMLGNGFDSAESDGESDKPDLSTFGEDVIEPHLPPSFELVKERVAALRPELEQVIHLLTRYELAAPLIITNDQSLQEELFYALKTVIDNASLVETYPDMVIDAKLLPKGFSAKRLLKLSAPKLHSLMQVGQLSPFLTMLCDNLENLPGVVLIIQDAHLLRSGGRGVGVECGDVVFSRLVQAGVRFIATTTAEGFSQSFSRSELMQRYVVPLHLEYATDGRMAKLIDYREGIYANHYNVTFAGITQSEFLRLSGRYLREQPTFTAVCHLIDATAGEARMRVGSLPKSRNAGPRVRVVQADLLQGLSYLTKLPVSELEGRNELAHLQTLTERLRSAVIGQDEAVHMTARAIQRSRIGLRDPRRPIASFLFTGPTGVGKTHLAKSLAKEIFGSEDAMLRLDMSEFAERYTVSRLIGSPPGYVGYGDGGELTEPVRTRPHRLVLLDEIEKAHPDIYNILLQLLDDGRLTDSEGRTVDFTSTIIIMTSNVGSRQAATFARNAGFEGVIDETVRHKSIIRKEMERTFSPEFLGRLDGVVTFSPLSTESLEQIIQLELKPIKERIATAGYALEVTEAALRAIYQSKDMQGKGARPLRQGLQSAVEDKALDYILSGDLLVGDRFLVDYSDGDYVYRVERSEAQPAEPEEDHSPRRTRTTRTSKNSKS